MESTKCVNCGRAVKDLEKGCDYCNSNKNNARLQNIRIEGNFVAGSLKVIAWIILVIGFVLGFIQGKDEFDTIEIGSLLSIWMMYFGAYIGVYAFGEIIQILHDIRLKLYKK